jgi:hypothetical protein
MTKLPDAWQWAGSREEIALQLAALTHVSRVSEVPIHIAGINIAMYSEIDLPVI